MVSKMDLDVVKAEYDISEFDNLSSSRHPFTTQSSLVMQHVTHISLIPGDITLNC